MPLVATYSGQVVVQVLDDNDNAPMFEFASTRVSLLESSAVNVTLPEAYLATDADIGTNAEIRYSLSPDRSFTVDPITGIVEALGFEGC